MGRSARWLAVLALVAGLVAGVPPGARAEGPACGPGDLPETGVQGDVPTQDQLSGRSRQGYRCNIRLLATNDLEGHGGDIQLTWAGRCAYQPAPAGEEAETVYVLDVADPAEPTVTAKLFRDTWAGKGGDVLGIHEGIHADRRRGILVVPIGYSISVFDISRDCRRPVHLADLEFPPPGTVSRDPRFRQAGIHSGQLSPDGTLYYATDLGNGSPHSAPDGPCLTVIDLANPAAPKLYTRVGLDFPCHDLELRPDGKRAYVGYYAPNAGYPAAVGAAFTPVNQPSYALTGVRVLDLSEVAARVPDPRVPIVSEITGGRQHTEVYARIGGREYLLGGEEAVCPGGNGRIVDITDEDHPVHVADLSLEINTMPNCPAGADNANADVLYQMSHYFSVDDPNDAHLAFYTWYGSGLRVFDIRDPHHPKEIAYYNPPVGEGSQRTSDWSSSYPRYDRRRGLIWFGSRVNGFNVVELAPRLRPRYRGLHVSRSWLAPEAAGPVVAGAAARSIDPGPAPGVGFCTLPGRRGVER